MGEDFLSYIWSGGRILNLKFLQFLLFQRYSTVLSWGEMEYVVRVTAAKPGTNVLTNKLGNMLQNKIASLKSPPERLCTNSKDAAFH